MNHLTKRQLSTLSLHDIVKQCPAEVTVDGKPELVILTTAQYANREKRPLKEVKPGMLPLSKERQIEGRLAEADASR